MLQGLKGLMPLRLGHRQDLPFGVLFKKFKSILERNNRILEMMADMGEKSSGEYVFDRQYLVSAVEGLSDQVFRMISDLSVLSEHRHRALFLAFERIQHQIREELAGRHVFAADRWVVPLFDPGGDADDLEGGKMAALADLHVQLNLSVPDGFVITTKAFLDFMRHNNLIEPIEKGIAAWDDSNPQYLETLSDSIQQGILQGEIPGALASQIDAHLDSLQRVDRNRPILLALRSSAWREDEDPCFAGQYVSLLNIPRSQVHDGYRRVLAGAYNCTAWRSRLLRDYRENEFAMAVGCQVMKAAAVSGVVHTFSDEGGQGVLLVNAVWGLCLPLVNGEIPADTFVLSRTAPYALQSAAVADKPRRLEACPEGGTVWENVPADMRHAASLLPEQLVNLAEKCMSIERYYKRPQEIEWAFDMQGELYILQSRPLPPQSMACENRLQVTHAMQRAEVIFENCGFTAQRGVAVGPVRIVTDDADLEAFPNGAILVTKHTSPRYARVMDKARGIITDVGSPTGHMATIAREYRLPALVNTEIATHVLRNGDEITLDATQKAVYRGRITELAHFELTEEMVFEESYEYRLLRRLLKHISPLNLVDPHERDFTPEACRTYHDITRFIHEKAVAELIAMSERFGRRKWEEPKRLNAPIPLGLVVIDAGGGLRQPSLDKEITWDQIESLPLKELLSGMFESGMWCTEPVSVDIGSFMSSFTRTFCANLAAPEKVGRNLAVIFKEYMNLHLRLGYHFNIIDAFICDRINDNYIYFRFLGGVTDFLRRSRRVRFIGEILERFDFRVEMHGDLVIGRIKKLSLPRMVRRMRMLGSLIDYTRQLDTLMHDDSRIEYYVDEFLERVQDIVGGINER